MSPQAQRAVQYVSLDYIKLKLWLVSGDHLIFQCNYSWEVWSQTAARCQITSPRDWPLLIAYLNGLAVPKKSQDTHPPSLAVRQSSLSGLNGMRACIEVVSERHNLF